MMHEGDPLLPSSQPQVLDKNKESSNNKFKWVSVPLFLATVYVGNIALFSVNKSLTSSPIDENFSSSSSSLTINVHSGYGQPRTIIGRFYSDMAAVVEPHRLATLSVSSDSSEFDVESSSFTWSITEETINYNDNELKYFDSAAFAEQEDTTVYHSPSFSFQPKFQLQKATMLLSSASIAHHHFGNIARKRFLVSVQCIETGEKASLVVHGKYVRRELRSLSDEDRELYLGAMHKVYTTDTKTGIEIYGETYKGYDYFAYHHLGPAQMNHPWHNTPAFFTSHAIFSAQFEESMQLIEPSVAMCYWDFVEDSVKYADVRKLKNGWAESEIWSSKWFGPMAFSEDGLFETTEISNTEKRLSGRWADGPMCLSANDAIGQNGRTGFQHNSYGWSRDVNNNNPATTATRSFEICGLKTTSMGLPGCFELLGALNSEDISECHSASEGGLHNSLHPKIGGAWECGYNFRSLEHRMKVLGKEYPKIIASMATSLQGLWRVAYFSGELSRPDHCQLSTPFEECQLYCSDLESELEQMDGGKNGYNGNWYVTEPSGESLSSERWDAHFRSKVIIGKNHPAVSLEVDIDEDTGRYHFTAFDKSEHTIQDELKAALVVSTCRPGKIGEFMGPLGAAQDPMFFPVHSQFERIWQYMRITKGMDSKWPDTPFDDDDALDFTPIGQNFMDPCEPFTDIFGLTRLPLGTIYTNQEIAAMVNPSNTQFLPFIYDDASFDICLGKDKQE